MQRYDLAAFESMMQELAECYDRRPFGAAAIKHWFEALANYPWEKVKQKLTFWRDNKPRAPMIAELIALLREDTSDELEARAKADKTAFLRQPTPVTPHGVQCLSEIKRLLSNPNKPSRKWAYELRDAHHAGKSLSHVQIEMAKKAYGSDWNSDAPFSSAKTKAPVMDGEY